MNTFYHFLFAIILVQVTAFCLGYCCSLLTISSFYFLPPCLTPKSVVYIALCRVIL